MTHPTPRIAIVGPDGTGKSTIVENVRSALEEAGLRVRHVHFDPRNANRVPKVVTQPHELAPRGLIGSLATVAVRGVRFARAQRSAGSFGKHGFDYVLQERGWLDQWVDPRRYRMHDRSRGLVRALSTALAAYDAVIVCGGDPKAIHARKPEIGERELARQLDAWSRLTSGRAHVLALDTTTRSQEECVAEALRFVRATRARIAVGSLRRVVGVPGRLQMAATPSSRRASEALYRPQSAAGRGRKLLRFRGSFERRPKPDPQLERLLSQMDVRFDAFATIRSVGRTRAVVAFLVSQEVTSFVKVSWDGAGLTPETTMLASLLDEPIEPLHVPQILQHLRLTDLEAFEMTAVPGTYTNEHEPAVVVGTALALAEAFGGRGVTHGDFTPWNLLSGQPSGLVDWEHSSFDFVPGLDLAHYLVRSGDAADPSLTIEYIAAYAAGLGVDADALAPSIHAMIRDARKVSA